MEDKNKNIEPEEVKKKLNIDEAGGIPEALEEEPTKENEGVSVKKK